uniref:G-protein coupled receptors family 1 profile domain-containing protein n=1 Tax=Xiphophorus couchianus TaxID=32473 RepID=A0A3B5L5P6_9TELE
QYLYLFAITPYSPYIHCLVHLEIMAVFYAAVFGCILVFGLPLNAVSLWILLFHHGLRSPNAVFMINLAISDLMLAITLPMRVYFYATDSWPLSNFTCVLVTMLFRNNIRSSSIFITFISVDRLLAVVYPLRTRHIRTLSNAVKGVVLVWLFVIVLNIPEGIRFSTLLNSMKNSTCFESVYSDIKGNSSTTYIQSTLEFILLAVNVGCTVMVFWTLRHHLSESAKVNSKVNVMVIFALNLVMFCVCFLPLSITALTRTKGSELTPMICLATVNCCLDPLCYYFSLDAFWKKREEADGRRDRRTNETE